MLLQGLFKPLRYLLRLAMPTLIVDLIPIQIVQFDQLARDRSMESTLTKQAASSTATDSEDTELISLN
jgi:hypothetical protein